MVEILERWFGEKISPIRSVDLKCCRELCDKAEHELLDSKSVLICNAVACALTVCVCLALLCNVVRL